MERKAMTGSKRYTLQFMLLVVKKANQAKTYAEVARKYELVGIAKIMV